MTLSLIIIFCVIASIAICYQIYFDKVIAKRIPIKRKQKIFELLKEEYEGLEENNLGFLEYKKNDMSILFGYKSRVIGNSFSNDLTLYLDITNIEDDIKSLCKIHFYCANIDNRDYVSIRVDVFYETLKRLAKHSKKTMNDIISETEFYISQKRAERDKTQINPQS